MSVLHKFAKALQKDKVAQKDLQNKEIQITEYTFQGENKGYHPMSIPFAPSRDDFSPLSHGFKIPQRNCEGSDETKSGGAEEGVECLPSASFGPHVRLCAEFRGKHHVGTATVIQTNALMTAAHCLVGFRSNSAERYGPAEEVNVSYAVLEGTSWSWKETKVKSAFFLPDWITVNNAVSDYAVALLEEKIEGVFPANPVSLESIMAHDGLGNEKKLSVALFGFPAAKQEEGVDPPHLYALSRDIVLSPNREGCKEVLEHGMPTVPGYSGGSFWFFNGMMSDSPYSFGGIHIQGPSDNGTSRSGASARVFLRKDVEVIHSILNHVGDK